MRLLAILTFNPDYRRIWMFPRNIRSITPLKIYQILTVLMKCSDLEYKNKQDQGYIYAMLDDAGIKKKANVKDENPGGMRTYYAQLETLGLIYESSKGDFRYTIAGQELADGNDMQDILQYQLLRNQYPSAYGLNQNVKMDPRLKVKPFLFIITLLHDERLDYYLTCTDIIIPVVYGHNDDCYDICVKKILKRRVSHDSIESIFDNFLLDLYTPRSGMGKNINNVKDIANTAKNYLEACGLLVSSGKVDGELKYKFDSRFEGVYRKLKDEPFLACEKKEDEESFQRAYGRYLSDSDTRSLDETAINRENPETAFVQFRYALYANANPFVDDSGFYKEMESLDIEDSFVAESIVSYSNMRKTIDRNNFLDYASANGLKAKEFESSLKNIFKRMGFIPVHSIHNINRNDGLIYLLFESSCEGERCLVIASDSPNYSYDNEDIPDKAEINETDYILLIANTFAFDINRLIMEESKKIETKISAFNSRTLLKIYEESYSCKNPCRLILSILQEGGYTTETEVDFYKEG